MTDKKGYKLSAQIFRCGKCKKHERFYQDEYIGTTPFDRCAKCIDKIRKGVKPNESKNT